MATTSNIKYKVEVIDSGAVNEQNGNGIWYYKKWSNGDFEYYLYIANKTTTGQAIAVTIVYPITFTSLPCVWPAHMTSWIGGHIEELSSDYNTTSGCRIIMKTTAADTFDIAVYVQGRWK